MAYKYLTNLADVLRAEGLKVVELDGWRTRGRPASSGGFDPVGVLCHHTATSKASSTDAVLRLLVGGRSDLPGPLCQLGLGRDGTVYLVAAGRANHGGTAKSSGTVAAGDANNLYIGIEAFNDGVGEPWPKVQYDAYVKLCAALSTRVTGNSAQTVRAHKETSVTGKIDPTFNMDKFRADVAAAMKPAPKPKPTKAPKRRPFDLATCNTMAASNAPREKATDILSRTLEEFPDAVVVGVVEASNLLGVTAPEFTPKHDTRALVKIQAHRLDKAGVAAVIDADRVVVESVRYRLGASPSINGARIKMRTRWVLVVVAKVDGRRRKFRVLHLPPKRFWALWPSMIARVGKTGADMGDFNRLARAVGPATGKRPSMSHIVGITTPLSWRISKPRSVDVGADHPAVGITVNPKEQS